MSEQNTIPLEMLEAATVRHMLNQGHAVKTVKLFRQNDDPIWRAAQRHTRLILEAAGVAKMAARIAELEADAKRYRWLREQDWDTGPLAVVRDPKLAVKWGHDLPSRARLDEAIDAAIKAPTKFSGRKVPTIEEMSGSIDYGGTVDYTRLGE